MLGTYTLTCTHGGTLNLWIQPRHSETPALCWPNRHPHAQILTRQQAARKLRDWKRTLKPTERLTFKANEKSRRFLCLTEGLASSALTVLPKSQGLVRHQTRAGETLLTRQAAAERFRYYRKCQRENRSIRFIREA